jgi:hypothetical protein
LCQPDNSCEFTEMAFYVYENDIQLYNTCPEALIYT